tara:strand:+ start:250 stop:546 length:297 start_codon:yes stop_codon:yes gene_type:complete
MNKYVNKVQAILNLVGGGISAIDEDVTYLSGQTPPTEEEVDAEVIRLQSEYDALQYQRDRQYPSIGDQLDMQYHDELNGTTTWKDAVAKVKADNPKPE